ncbi:TetR/AcrR family transcriptional regulator [Nocardia sp. CA-120079]|uniref:TetR/AcrR family transcriptional regulator n=1 Tax=Nocardia sp. CA-120079 TaxID=3239974 RepID=UPI003D95F6E2
MPARPAKHRESSQARRAKLLDAAIEIIADSGVSGATHRAIATRAGVPLSTTSYFFASLDELIAAALQLVAERIVARAQATIEEIGKTGLSPEDAIDRFVERQLEVPRTEAVAQFELYLECARRPELQASAHQVMANVERVAESALRTLGIARPAERAPVVVALMDGLDLHRQAWPRGEADRRVMREALLGQFRTFTAEDTATRREIEGV